LLCCGVVGTGGEIVLQALVGVEFVGHPTSLQFIGQLDALRERRQLVINPVKEAERGQAFEMVQDTILVLWVAIDNTSVH
jgi:hypothetical protein